MGVDDRRIARRLFIVVAVAYAYFFNGGGWNQNATFDLTRALVERRTFHIDRYHANTYDLTGGRHWHMYANKPPGTSMLAAVPYLVVYNVERVFGADVDSRGLMTFNLYLLTFFVCGLTGAAIPAVLYLYGRRRVGASQVAALSVSLVIAFGTYLFSYSTVLFAHVPSALFLLAAFCWLDERPLFAGAAAGIAGLCTYLCIVAAAIYAIALLVRSRVRALRFIAGGLPFAVFLLVYQYVCFGSPWRTSVADSTIFTDQHAWLGVFLRPSIRALWEITIGRYRGLFYLSPVLVFTLAGGIVMFRRRVMRRELAMIGAVAIAFVFSNICFNGWQGGAAIGPRYLSPIVPLLAIPMMFATALFRPLWYVLTAISFAVNFAVVAVEATPPTESPDPVGQTIIPKFLHGELSVNTQAASDVGPSGRAWASFNLGEVMFGASNPLSLGPITLWMLGGSALLIRETSGRGRKSRAPRSSWSKGPSPPGPRWRT